MIEQRLFRLAPESVSLSATFVGGEGWRLRVQMRRQGELWAEGYQTHYSHLSTEELLDVIEREASQQLLQG